MSEVKTVDVVSRMVRGVWDDSAGDFIVGVGDGSGVTLGWLTTRALMCGARVMPQGVSRTHNTLGYTDTISYTYFIYTIPNEMELLFGGNGASEIETEQNQENSKESDR